MPVTVTVPFAHPTVRFVGRTCGVDPGAQERTAGTEVVVVVETEVLVDECAEVVEGAAVGLVAGGEDFERTATPTATPTPRATRTIATKPTRRTVLRRTVNSRGSLCATKGNGSAPHCMTRAVVLTTWTIRPLIHPEDDCVATRMRHNLAACRPPEPLLLLG
jgi:hypothetical protein